MKLRFLGTGTSFGVPVIGCSCAACTSSDPRDRRTRHAALLTAPGGTLLVDTPPELRLQMLHAGSPRIDAVWYTHDHADHTHGIDDLRVFSTRNGILSLHAQEQTAASLTRRFTYIFDPNLRPPEGTSKPELAFTPFSGSEPVDVAGMKLTPLEVPHGEGSAWGFRVGSLAYITDGKSIPERVMREIRGVDVLVLNALWFGNPHPTHFNVEEAIDAARSVGARRTYLTHLTHRTTHQSLLDRLPDGIEPAWDGLEIEIDHV